MSSHRALAALSGWRIPHLEALVDCDLLLHFDQTDPAKWRDYSIHQRALTIVPESSTVVQSPDGEFRGAADFDQVAPGSGNSAFFNTQAFVQAAGLIDPGADEFFWCAWVNVPALPVNNAQYVIVGNRRVDGGNLPGFEFGLHRNDMLSLTLGPYAAFGTTSGTARVEAVSNIAADTWAFVAASRKRGPPGNPDNFSIFINGVRSNTVAVDATNAVDLGADPTIVGAVTTFGTSSPDAIAYGYQGLLDEVFLGHGDGWGIFADFTPPTVPFSQKNRLPPFTG